MKHCIIVKWNESVTDKKEMLDLVSVHFERAKQFEWVESVEIIPNCIDRSNRYDLAIAISISPEELHLWDECDVHKEWKDLFSSRITQKAIFDFEA